MKRRELMQQPNNAPIRYSAWNANIHCRPHKLQQTDMGSNKRHFFAVPVFFVIDGGFTHGCISMQIRWSVKNYPHFLPQCTLVFKFDAIFLHAPSVVSFNRYQLIYLLDRFLHVLFSVDKSVRFTSAMHR